MVTGDKITTLHGSGGPETIEIIKRFILSKIPNNLWKASGGYGLDVLDDGSTILVNGKHFVLSIDSFTVNPIFFPGGDIGHLAVSGVINDLVMMGARPIAFMDTIVVEEGFPIRDLEKIIDSITTVLKKYNIALIGGDFKVMPRNTLDKIIVTGMGIGYAEKPIIDKPRPGDKIIVSGPIADHGATILAAQLGLLEENTGLRSDSRPLIDTVLPVLEKYRDYINAARDPTRGGLATTLNEWVNHTEYAIIINRSSIPIREEVKYFLDALGIDPLNVASEGVAVLSARPDVAEDIVDDLMRRGEKYATIIGEVVEPKDEVVKGRVIAITEVGGKTLVQPNALNLPRIC